MSMIEIRIPDIGDFKDVPIIEVHVKTGDAVAVEDPLLTLESDKATLEVPCPQDLLDQRVRQAGRHRRGMARERGGTSGELVD